MDNPSKKQKTQEGFYAYSVIRLLFSSLSFKNLLQDISHEDGLLGMFRNVALEQTIQVIRLTKFSFTKQHAYRTPALVKSTGMWILRWSSSNTMFSTKPKRKH